MLADKTLLFPYYFALKIRHFLYDKGVKKSYTFDIPIISVGNITVGGTGKTPHTELLVRMLKEKYKVAVISRGYKRETSGYREVTLQDSFKEVGDEPIQMKKKFPDIIVAVDSSRKRAIETLLELPQEKRPTVILLDDGFQHRKIKPTLSVLLIDYSRPIFDDHLIPIGNLRDLPSEIKRADLVIVTKAPDFMEYSEREEWRKRLKLPESKPLLFSKIAYDTPVNIFEEGDNRYLYSKSAILFSGISNDRPIRNYLVGQYKLIEVLKFKDHHKYSSEDLGSISSLSDKHHTSVVFTTEKDAQRIFGHKALTQELKSKLFYLPIQAEIIPDTSQLPRVIEEEKKSLGEKQFVETINKFLLLTL